MSGKSKFFDYEPLTNPEASRKGVPPTEEGFQRRPSSGSTSGKTQTFETCSIDLPTVAQEQGVNGTFSFSALIKRGHTVSFVGLFLFTLVLYVRPYEIFPTALWLRSITFWIAIVTIVVYIPTQLGLDGSLTIRPREVNLVLLLLLATFLSVPLASDRQIAWNGFVEYLKVVLMFIVLVNVIRTERRLKWLFLLTLVVSCFLSFAAVNDYRLGRLELGGQRIKGILGNMFDNPNDLALHLVTLIPLTVSMVFSSRAALKKLLYASCAILLAAGVVATFSRGGFLGMAFMGCVLGWRIARKNRWLVLMLAPLILIAFIALAPGGYGSRLSTTDDGSAVTRTADLKRSILVALRHPLFGVGVNNYALYSDRELATHNSYTQIASDTGIVAMLIYILFQLAPLKELRKIIHETSNKRAASRYHYLAIGLEASLCAYMVCSFFASVAYLWYVYYLVGYAICLRRLYAASKLQELSLKSTEPAQNTISTNGPLIAVG